MFCPTCKTGATFLVQGQCRSCDLLSDPRCVCTHQLSFHAKKDGVLACTVDDCACGPGCIHEGFVDSLGGAPVHNVRPRS